MKPNFSSANTRVFAVALLCAACFASIAAAQGNDSVRQEKMRAELKKRFAAADTNSDGRISRDEAKAGMPKVYRSFDAIDTGKTGFVSLEQIQVFAEKQSASR